MTCSSSNSNMLKMAARETLMPELKRSPPTMVLAENLDGLPTWVGRRTALHSLIGGQ